MIEIAEVPPKKRKRGQSPNARALAECKKRRWPAMTVEQTIPKTFIKRDLFSVIDIVAITPEGLLGIQVTDGSNHSHRREKILAEPRMEQWTLVGGLLELWSYAERGERGSKKEWTLRVERFVWADFAALVPGRAA